MAVLAAPLVIPFAEALGLSVAILGMDKASDKVNQFIKDNPEESMKIFQMIMPAQGIANALKNKSSEEVEEKISLEDLEGMSAEEAQDYDEPKDVTPPQEPVSAPTLETLTQPKIEEAEVVPEPPVSQFDKILEGLSVVPEEGEDIVAEEFHLCVPNNEPVIFQQPLDYMDAYNDLLLKVVKASKLAPAQKRTKMKELEQANLETFKLIPISNFDGLAAEFLQLNSQ